MVAGHSLGEFSALVVAGALSFEDGLRLVSKRALAMQAACEAQPGTMAAILGLADEVVEQACAETDGVVVAANYNCPGQLVISGAVEAVDAACEKLKAAGARRCIPLKVSGPFHTPLMAPAGNALREYFQGVAFADPQIPVIFNCLGDVKDDSTPIQELLVKQVQSSVYMEDTLHRLGELGVDHILEVGPGSALAGFVKKTLPGVVCASVETPEQLNAALTAWKEEL